VNLRILATLSVLASIVSVAGTASAQTNPGTFSVTVTGNWEPGIGGTRAAAAPFWA
jgi:hypothetical protein